MKELFKKIKTEDNLPEKDGKYIVQFKDYASNVIEERTFTKGKSEEVWKSSFDWYLQPLPQLREVTALREELIKYDVWLYSYGKASDAFTAEELVDLYLEQMKSGTK